MTACHHRNWSNFARLHLQRKLLTSIYWDSERVLMIGVGRDYDGSLLCRVNQETNCRLCSFQRKMPGKVASTRDACLHHEHLPVHTPTTAMAAIRKCRFKLLDHLPYFTDLTPSDFHVFQFLIYSCCEQTFTSNKNVMLIITQRVKQLGDGEFSSWTA